MSRSYQCDALTSTYLSETDVLPTECLTGYLAVTQPCVVVLLFIEASQICSLSFCLCAFQTIYQRQRLQIRSKYNGVPPSGMPPSSLVCLLPDNLLNRITCALLVYSDFVTVQYESDRSFSFGLVVYVAMWCRSGADWCGNGYIVFRDMEKLSICSILNPRGTL